MIMMIIIQVTDRDGVKIWNTWNDEQRLSIDYYAKLFVFKQLNTSISQSKHQVTV